jgi:hypothetical protein
MGNSSSSINTIDDVTSDIIRNYVINYKDGCLSTYGDKFSELEYSGRNYTAMNEKDFDEFLSSEEFLGCKSLRHKIHFKTLFQQLKEGLNNFGVITCAPDVMSVTNRSVTNTSILADVYTNSCGSKQLKDEEIDYLTDSSSDISEQKPAEKKTKLSTAAPYVLPITIKCQPSPVVFKTLHSKPEEFQVKVANLQGLHKYICWIENSHCEWKNVPIIKNIKGDQLLVLSVNSETL